MVTVTKIIPTCYTKKKRKNKSLDNLGRDPLVSYGHCVFFVYYIFKRKQIQWLGIGEKAAYNDRRIESLCKQNFKELKQFQPL